MKKPLPADKADMTLYSDLLADIKLRIRQAQNRAVMSANAEMIRMYWDIGHMVAKRQRLEGWGKGLLRRLAVDLKDELPEIKGFSERNLQLMIQFQREYPDLFEIPQRLVAELPDTSLPSKIQPQPGAGFDPNDSAQSEYAGKINFYCNVVDDKYRHTTDNPTIGLILCQDKKRVLAEYALRGLDKPIGISEYELTRALPDNLKSALPTIEEIEAELSAGLQDENEGDDKD